MHLQRMPNHETNVYLYSERKILTVPKSFGKLDAVKVNNKTKMRKIMENAIKMVHFNLCLLHRLPQYCFVHQLFYPVKINL